MDAAARRYVVTGADSGIGGAVAQRLRADGEVVTCGVGPDVDVAADLTTPAGRSDLLARVSDLTGGRVDGVVAAAGIGTPGPATAALNYFGTVAVLEGLRPLLAAGDAPAAVLVSSSSSLNRGSGALVRACLAGDEARALAVCRRLAATGRGSQVYRSSKIALNRWVRRTAVLDAWAGQGIVLNAVAPGIVATDVVMRTWQQDEPLLRLALPQPMGAPGPVEPVAALLAHLVSADNRFTTGQVVLCDGGSDALLRGDRPQRVFLRYPVRDVVAMVRAARRAR